MKKHDDRYMILADLMDWISSHGCKIIPLQEYQAKVIQFENPKNKCKAYLNLPPPERIKDFTVCRICTNLVIPLPSFLNYTKELNDKLKNEHNV